MNDSISRQAAINALDKEKPTPFINEDGSIDQFGAGQQNQWFRDGIAIMSVPSEQPASQETTAEWVPSTKYKGFLTCSACEDCYIEGWSDRERKWRFCPSCGARLIYEGHKN